MKSSGDTEDVSRFECNICLEVAKNPVVTLCGHLYCWPCLNQWFNSPMGAWSCPYCKADLEGEKYVPIYCREAETAKTKDSNCPPRRRPMLPSADSNRNPYHRQQMLYNQDMSQPAALWTVLGINVGPQGAAMTPEQQHQAFLTRLLLLLGSFVILCLLLF